MRHGVTLVELLVALVLLGCIAGMSALAFGRLRAPASAESREAARVSAARAQAIRTGLPVTVTRDTNGSILFLPDGRAVGEGIDPLTGVPANAP